MEPLGRCGMAEIMPAIEGFGECPFDIRASGACRNKGGGLTTGGSQAAGSRVHSTEVPSTRMVRPSGPEASRLARRLRLYL